ncbi:hypothetical protein E1267_18600 [Nonomuraea longispora]|uniref:Uncharacterized protein n=1 Tax=Nonomuraea longispora TaxID=1848320 RepID=A0A4R4NE16_9ACTN|nr:hypothetical protein [Nonomuraea longispora]TDC05720.1 hypothetical protein E1267_18600 [Nonomuraea longispora]
MTKILTIGLHPSAIDFSDHPGMDEATLAARIEQGEAALHAVGLDTVACLVGTDPDAAEKSVRERLSADGPFGLAMIGAGVRVVPEHTALFERLVNVLVAAEPGIRFCFNTTPETTIDAIRRWT